MRGYARRATKRIVETCSATSCGMFPARRKTFEAQCARRQNPMHFKEIEMNKDQTDGVLKQAKGKVNEAVGKVTNDPAQEAKGDMQQAAGKVQKGVGDAREDLKDSVKKNP
jgi:uncharacterized protein YjbJ (UPF0337 family)